MMRTPYREPEVEDSTQAVILQNRCGTRLSLLVYDDHAELECGSKPKAFRRKEFHARNFSNRSNHTRLFRSAARPKLSASVAARRAYDPLCTRNQFAAPSGAHNGITVLTAHSEKNIVSLSVWEHCECHRAGMLDAGCDSFRLRKMMWCS